MNLRVIRIDKNGFTKREDSPFKTYKFSRIYWYIMIVGRISTLSGDM